MPAPGQRVILIYEREDGTPSDMVFSTPVHEEFGTMLNGKPIYRPTICWQPMPELPERVENL